MGLMIVIGGAIGTVLEFGLLLILKDIGKIDIVIS